MSGKMININIVRCFTFSNNCLISNDKNLNNKAFESLNKQEKVNIINCHFPIGYEIQNITADSEIKHIKLPEYKVDKNNLVFGEIKEVTLKSNEFLILPIKYLMLLLFEQKDDLILANGKMVPFIKNISNNNFDIYLNNFIFEPLDNWNDLVNPLKNIYWYRNISYFYDIKNKCSINFKIIEPKMIKLFGNYNEIEQNQYIFNNNLSNKNNVMFLNYIIKGDK